MARLTLRAAIARSKQPDQRPSGRPTRSSEPDVAATNALRSGFVSSEPRTVLALQRAIGNQATTSLLGQGGGRSAVVQRARKTRTDITKKDFGELNAVLTRVAEYQNKTPGSTVVADLKKALHFGRKGAAVGASNENQRVAARRKLLQMLNDSLKDQPDELIPAQVRELRDKLPRSLAIEMDPSLHLTKNPKQNPPPNIEKPPEAIVPPNDAEPIPGDLAKVLGLEPFHVQEVSTFGDVDGKPVRTEKPTVLYHPKADVEVFHGTLTANVESILETGLQPSKAGAGGAKGLTKEPFNAPGYVYITSSPRDARAAAKNFFESLPQFAGRKKDVPKAISVIAVRLDPSIILVQDPDLASAVRTTAPLTNVRLLDMEGEEEAIAALTERRQKLREDAE